ncbi:MAG: MqnA/MqnD/SBP family protein, partial [Anaerovoracaceae bacterium]
PNTLGILYLTENKSNKIKNLSDIKDQTIYASGKGGSPEYILQEVLKKNKVDYSSLNIKWLATHSDVTAAHMKDPGSIALLPEPFVTVATSKNPNLKVVSDLNKEWDKITHQDLPMGVLVAQKSFVEDKGSDLEIFLKDYEASVDFVNNNTKEAAKAIESQKIIANAKIAEKAIPKCNIVLLTNSQSKETLSAFYETLFKLDPKSIGGKIPGDDFYYKSK